MARNEEKSQSMLNRWLAYKREQVYGRKPKVGRRPHNVQDIQSLGVCEHWRMQILRDVGKKIMEIQNESLGEQRIRDMNDEINTLLREKNRWERRILELGGPNYRKTERISDDAFVEDPTLVDQRGFVYKYFGAARNLPGVKELFAKQQQQAAKKKRKPGDYRGIDAEYYGYNDDDDRLLQELERQAEAKAIKEAPVPEPSIHDSEVLSTEAYLTSGHFHVPVPSKEEVEQLIIDKKKSDLMKKYLSDEFAEELNQQKEAVEVVLGKKQKT